MPDSILERVLLRKEDQEKQSFHPADLINTLLKLLAVKEADVLRRRFGLSEHGKETLEVIGMHYTVTRERIRQIENQSIKKIKSSSVFTDLIKPVDHLLTSSLSHHGGIMTKKMMFDTLLGEYAEQEEQCQSVVFIINELLDDKIQEVSKPKKYLPSWKLTLTSLEFVDRTIDELEKIIRTEGNPQIFDHLYDAFQQTEWFAHNPQQFTQEMILSYIDLSARLAKNPFDEYGLAEWGLIQPKRMNDRVYLVLKKEGKPMHFEEIARRITKVFKKTAYPPTVHNELILNEEYVLVGRGIYALREWGFNDGVVSHVIIDILQHAGRPLSRSEIVNAVLQQRIVKKNTIHLALTDKTVFQKTSEGKYTVAPSAQITQSLLTHN